MLLRLLLLLRWWHYFRCSILRVLDRLMADRGSSFSTIAHRINTILSSDRVVVMNAGRIVECGNTRELQNDPSSIFHTFL